jgi:uncharacterized membrane protein YuzA (DUF378 family)
LIWIISIPAIPILIIGFLIFELIDHILERLFK